MREFQETPLIELQPRWTEFTKTPGVLRCLQPKDPRTHATGMIFLCPHCKGHKKKQHLLIFLFQDHRVPFNARPMGRFMPTREFFKGESVPENFQGLTLHQTIGADGYAHFVRENTLKPQDVCGWEGTLLHGIVRFEKKKRPWWKS